jgi:ABC-type transporter Mla subunit MlaD
MAGKPNYFRLGLFVLVSLALGFVLLFVLGGRALFTPRTTIETYFNESVSGLGVGAPVQFRGVRVGEVSEIFLSSVYQADIPLDSRANYVVVRMRIDNLSRTEAERDYNAYVSRGLRAQTQLAGVTGQQFIGLDFLDPALNPPLPFTWTPKYPYLPSAPSLTNRIVANAQSFLASLDEADIAQLGQNLNRLVVTLDKRLTAFPMDKVGTELVATLAASRSAMERIDRTLAASKLDASFARVNKILSDPAFDSAPQDLAVIAARLRKLAESGDLERALVGVDQLLARSNRMLADNEEPLRAALIDLRDTLANLRVLTETVKRWPPGLFFSTPPQSVPLPVQPAREAK